MRLTEELRIEIQKRSGMYDLSPFQAEACIAAYNLGLEHAANSPMQFELTNKGIKCVFVEEILKLKITNIKTTDDGSLK